MSEESRKVLGPDANTRCEITTYHGFAWNIIQCHGYLLNGLQRARLLPPPDAAARLAHIQLEDRDFEKKRLFLEEGLCDFDIFAPICSELLERSAKLRGIIADAYPYIIVDEFQDTNSAEWAIIKSLGQRSCIMALADADQRIYEFRGANPQRISEYFSCCAPAKFDFGKQNHRSAGTDITTFGNDLLHGANKGKVYNNVTVVRYGFYRGHDVCFPLKSAVLSGLKRLRGIEDWSIAVLVPSKQLMLSVSRYLSCSKDGLPILHHDVAVDPEGVSLAATGLAILLQGGSSVNEIARAFLQSLCMHIRGRRGAREVPPPGELALADALEGYLSSTQIKGSRRVEIVSEAMRIATLRMEMTFTGDPKDDWLAIRKLLERSASPEIRAIAENASYLSLLSNGTTLRERLSEAWRRNGCCYCGAVEIVRNAITQEHFAASSRRRRGINVMTIHKAKGKEFDEVFVFEGYKNGKIVRQNCNEKDLAQARLSLRVGVTRARRRATILSPKSDCCPLL